MNDPYNLQRFIEAQNKIYKYKSILNELKVGQKCNCWMWYVFPQLKGLGESLRSQKYAISSQGEARAYLVHPILGPRLRECTQLVINVEKRNAEEIFHHPDHLKFRSCMTLFGCSTIDNQLFQEALLKYFDGKPDQVTLNILKKQKANL